MNWVDPLGLKNNTSIITEIPKSPIGSIFNLLNQVLTWTKFANGMNQMRYAQNDVNYLATQIPCGEKRLGYFCYKEGFPITSWSVGLGTAIYGYGLGIKCENLLITGTKDCCPPCDSPYGCYQSN